MTRPTISILGSGWLGLPLVEHFVSRGYRVKASTTSATRVPELSVRRADAFVLDIGQPTPQLGNFLQSSILIINIPSKDIDGFARLVTEIERAGVDKVLFVGSTSVYGNTNRTITESDGLELPQHPLVRIENLLTSNDRFMTTIVRFGGLIGYDRHPGRFFRGGKIVRDPDAFVNLIHRDDCINIIGKIVTDDIWGEVFNCCADTHPTKREFYRHAAELLGVPPPIMAEPEETVYKIISNRKVRQVLDYAFEFPDLMEIRYDEDR